MMLLLISCKRFYYNFQTQNIRRELQQQLDRRRCRRSFQRRRRRQERERQRRRRQSGANLPPGHQSHQVLDLDPPPDSKATPSSGIGSPRIGLEGFGEKFRPGKIGKLPFEEIRGRSKPPRQVNMFKSSI